MAADQGARVAMGAGFILSRMVFFPACMFDHYAMYIF